MRPPQLTHLIAGPLLLVLVGLSAAACDDDDTGDTAASGPTVGTGATTTTTLPPQDTEFCRGMVTLATEDDRPVDDEDLPDAAEQVLSTYRSLVDEAPLEIRSEMEAVIARLERELAGETLTDDELVVAEESAYRIALYVDLNCEGVANNPGPPPTAPE